jgi:hypothetical protein
MMCTQNHIKFLLHDAFLLSTTWRGRGFGRLARGRLELGDLLVRGVKDLKDRKIYSYAIEMRFL